MELLSCDSWLVSLSVEVIVLIVWGGFVVDSLTTDAQERLFSEVLLKLLTDSSTIVRCGLVFFGWNVIVELNLILGV